MPSKDRNMLLNCIMHKGSSLGCQSPSISKIYTALSCRGEDLNYLLQIGSNYRSCPSPIL